MKNENANEAILLPFGFGLMLEHDWVPSAVLYLSWCLELAGWFTSDKSKPD